MPLNAPSTVGTGLLYSVSISSAPSARGTWSDISTAFSGDLSKIGFPLSYSVSGTATLGQPTSGYQYNPECSPVSIYLKNTSGWNNGTADNTGRTAATIFRCKIDNYGQGDAVVYNGEAYANGARSGATHYLANPAASICNGNVSAGSNGVYLNPFEVLMDDKGFDVAGQGYVSNSNRTVNTGALSVVWYGFNSQSLGTKDIEAHFRSFGGALVGLDLSASTLSQSVFKLASGNKPTVTGSRGGNAALASLLTALATLGLITDSTS